MQMLVLTRRFILCKGSQSIRIIMACAELIKDIYAKSLKKVQDRLKKEKPNQKHTEKGGVFYSPLHAAVKTNSGAIVDAVLGAGAVVDTVDNAGATPLHWAVQNKDGDSAAIVRSLLKKKAKPDALNTANQTPWHIAAVSGSAAAITELAAADGAAGLDSVAPGQTPLCAAVMANQHAVIAALLQAGAKLSTQDTNGMTALMHLIVGGRVGDAQQLLDLGDCNVNAQGTAAPTEGLTALTLVVPGNATINMDTPGAAALITTLLEKGASTDVQLPNKDTPITWAITNKHTSLAMQLIKKGKKLGIKNSAGRNAMDLAISTGSDEIITALIGAGADMSDPGALLKSALSESKDKLLAELIRVVKEAPLNSAGITFMSLRDKRLCEAALAYLSRFDKQMLSDSTVDGEGNTTLHALSETGAPYDLILGMIKLGLGPNTSNKAGDCPLHVAAKAGHVEVCRALLDAGADALRRNGKNRRPREMPKIPDSTREFLMHYEEEAKERKIKKDGELWDEKMRATQTESACVLRSL